MKAVEWFEKAAEQGMAEAQVALGDALMSGTGVTQDHGRSGALVSAGSAAKP